MLGYLLCNLIKTSNCGVIHGIVLSTVLDVGNVDHVHTVSYQPTYNDEF